MVHEHGERPASKGKTEVLDFHICGFIMHNQSFFKLMANAACECWLGRKCRCASPVTLLETIDFQMLQFVEFGYAALECPVYTWKDNMLHGVHFPIDNLDDFIQNFEWSFQQGQSKGQFNKCEKWKCGSAAAVVSVEVAVVDEGSPNISSNFQVSSRVI